VKSAQKYDENFLKILKKNIVKIKNTISRQYSDNQVQQLVKHRHHQNSQHKRHNKQNKHQQRQLYLILNCSRQFYKDDHVAALSVLESK
jgi:hypothetical protein